jgi:phosphoribosylformylglycinamidine synthase subunit I (EC 6.3.5.3)
VSVAVIQFGGSNCDRDVVTATGHIGLAAQRVWHSDALPADATAVVLPGGFSYGDYLRPGAMAARSPIMAHVEERLGTVPVLGICNGAQVGAERGLVPGSFTTNTSARFQCEWVHCRVETTATPFTAAREVGDVLHLPIAHGAGRYLADEETVASLEADGRVLLRYCDASGAVTPAANPNGSVGNIAAVIGAHPSTAVMMPHPERATVPGVSHSTDGAAILAGLAGPLS